MNRPCDEATCQTLTRPLPHIPTSTCSRALPQQTTHHPDNGRPHYPTQCHGSPGAFSLSCIHCTHKNEWLTLATDLLHSVSEANICTSWARLSTAGQAAWTIRHQQVMPPGSYTHPCTAGPQLDYCD